LYFKKKFCENTEREKERERELDATVDMVCRHPRLRKATPLFCGTKWDPFSFCGRATRHLAFPAEIEVHWAESFVFALNR